jgi:cytochrome c-type biogenesis protein CcmH/NrfG
MISALQPELTQGVLMPAVSQRTWLLAGVTLLVIAAFALGYLAGRNSQPASSDTAPAISMSDMRGVGLGNSPAAPGIGAHEPAQAGSLSALVSGLENKVAADPGNIDQQLLLARTYQELGERDKGLKLLHKLQQRDTANVEVKITLATLLMEGGDSRDLQAAERLLEDAVRLKPQVVPMARLYQGDIQLKLGDSAKALKIWKGYLAGLPAGDEQRALFQQRIAQVSN